LKLKAKFESGSSFVSFKRWNQVRSTWGQSRVTPGSTKGQPAPPYLEQHALHVAAAPHEEGDGDDAAEYAAE
jgi:hypothetical protein